MERSVNIERMQAKNGKPSEKTVSAVKSLQPDDNTMKNSSKVILGVYALLVLLGIGTGFLLSKKTGIAGSLGGPTPAVINTGKTVGSTDTKTFNTTADGVLRKGGSDGEGTYHLDRTGGPSQTAYLISSVVDLDQFVGKTVRVWGQTMQPKKVSWLMDVGKVELISE